jgi:hypothetical protein
MATLATATAAPVEVTICHGTGSASNPFVQITLNERAVREGRGHNRDGHQSGQDIIPPGPHDPDGRNWTAEGQAIHDNDCVPAAVPIITLPPSR